MKKLLLVLSIAAFVACNDSGNTEETPAADTTPAVTTPAPTVDTSGAGSDTTKVADTSVKK